MTWSNECIVVPAGAAQGRQYFSAEDEGNCIAIWDTRTGHLVRTFSSLPEHVTNSKVKKQMQWPALKWSPDEKYVARVVPGEQISVYELPSMGLVGKRSIKIPGIVDCDWCPHAHKYSDLRSEDPKITAYKNPSAKDYSEKENIMAFWTPEVANQPARVSLMHFPSRTILRTKNLFNVTEVVTSSLLCDLSAHYLRYDV